MSDTTHAFVDVQAMQVAKGQVDDAHAKNEQIKNTVQEVQADLAAEWTGEASSGFGRAIESWLEQFGNIQKSLNDISDQLETNRSTYNTTEQNQQDNSSQLHALLSAT